MRGERIGENLGKLSAVEHFDDGFPFISAFCLRIIEEQFFFPRHVINHPTEEHFVGGIAMPRSTARELHSEVGGNGVERTDTVVIEYVDGAHTMSDIGIDHRQRLCRSSEE